MDCPSESAVLGCNSELSKEAPHDGAGPERRAQAQLPTAVLHDAHGERYVGLYGGDTLRVAETVAQLDSADNYTFQIPIYRILIRPNKEPLILFQNGGCLTLSYGLEHCKRYNRRALIKALSVIEDATTYTANGREYVCLAIKDKHDGYEVVTYRMKNETYDYHSLKTSSISKSKYSRQRGSYVIHCCILRDANDIPYVHIIWCDGYFRMYNIIRDG